MSVVVAYKWAPDPMDAVVDADGAVDWARGRPGIGEYDQAAIASARQLADALAADLVGVSVGGPALAGPLAKKAALARGIDQAQVVADEAAVSWNPTRTAAALAQLARRAEASVVVTGDASLDEGGRIMPSLIAGYLGWPCFADVTRVRVVGDGWQLDQRGGAGQRTIQLAGPVVVSISPDAATPTVSGMKDLLAAARKPLTVVPIAELVLPDVPVRVVERRPADARMRRRRLFSGPDAAAAALAAMRADGVLDGGEGHRG